MSDEDRKRIGQLLDYIKALWSGEDLDILLAMVRPGDTHALMISNLSDEGMRVFAETILDNANKGLS